MKYIHEVEQDVSGLRGRYFVRAVIVADDQKQAIELLLDAIAHAIWKDSPQVIVAINGDRLEWKQIGTAYEEEACRVVALEIGEEDPADS